MFQYKDTRLDRLETPFTNKTKEESGQMTPPKRSLRADTIGKLFLSEMHFENASERRSSASSVFKNETPLAAFKRKLKPSVFQAHSHLRIRGNFFHEENIATRPAFYTQEMIDIENSVKKDELVHYAEQISMMGRQAVGVSPTCIIRHHGKVTGIERRISHLRAPPSSVKVQWRQGRIHKVPTLAMAFLLLNRTSPVVALIKLTSNSAICVFESMAGATKVVLTWNCQQSSRLLILSWWYPQYAQAEERQKIKDNKWSTTIWLSEEMFVLKKSFDGTLNQLINFDKKNRPGLPYKSERTKDKPDNPSLDTMWRPKTPMQDYDSRFTRVPAINTGWKKRPKIRRGSSQTEEEDTRLTFNEESRISLPDPWMTEPVTTPS